MRIAIVQMCSVLSTNTKPRAVRVDWQGVAMLSLVAVTSGIFLGIGLGELEFFRHTEADRSLIAWEMFETGELLVPHLLGSQVLTKPPLFYWLQVASFQLFQNVSEFTARFPSFLMGVCSCILLLLTAMRLQFSYRESLFLVLVLLTSSQFFVLARSAEIDMTYGFFCWLALTLLFFAEYSSRFWLLLAAYLFVGLAFLTKGPPIVVIFAGAVVLLRAVVLRRSPIAPQWLLQHVAGLFLFLLPVGAWILLLISSVGWEALVIEFETEILSRAWEPSERNRGFFFYPTGLLLIVLPWSVIAISALAVTHGLKGLSLRPFARQSLTSYSLKQFHFIYYSLVVLVFTTLLLSISAGKSYRYLFPVHLLLAFLTGVLLLHLVRHATVRTARVEPAGAVLILALVALGIISYLLHRVLEAEVSRVALLVLSGLLLLVSVCWYYGSIRGSIRWLCLGGLVLIVLLRIGYSTIYVTHRNADRSVVALASELHQTLPSGAPLYILEMFERWVLFYFKQYGRDAMRVDPEMAEALANSGEIFLLLNESEESWRVAELRHFDPETKVVLRLDDPRRPLLLVQTSGGVLKFLDLQRRFPTEPTIPKLSESFAMSKPRL